MNWSDRIRHIHRWLAIAFTVAIILNFAVMGRGDIALWVGLATLLPLSRLVFTASDLPTKAIADEIGYESEAAFSRAFERQFGLPPGKWRRQLA